MGLMERNNYDCKQWRSQDCSAGPVERHGVERAKNGTLKGGQDSGWSGLERSQQKNLGSVVSSTASVFSDSAPAAQKI